MKKILILLLLSLTFSIKCQKTIEHVTRNGEIITIFIDSVYQVDSKVRNTAFPMGNDRYYYDSVDLKFVNVTVKDNRISNNKIERLVYNQIPFDIININRGSTPLTRTPRIRAATPIRAVCSSTARGSSFYLRRSANKNIFGKIIGIGGAVVGVAIVALSGDNGLYAAGGILAASGLTGLILSFSSDADILKASDLMKQD